MENFIIFMKSLGLVTLAMPIVILWAIGMYNLAFWITDKLEDFSMYIEKLAERDVKKPKVDLGGDFECHLCDNKFKSSDVSPVKFVKDKYVCVACKFMQERYHRLITGEEDDVTVDNPLSSRLGTG